MEGLEALAGEKHVDVLGEPAVAVLVQGDGADHGVVDSRVAQVRRQARERRVGHALSSEEPEPFRMDGGRRGEDLLEVEWRHRAASGRRAKTVRRLASSTGHLAIYAGSGLEGDR